MLLNPQLFVLPHDELRKVGAEALTYGSLTEKGLATITKTLRRFVRPYTIQGLDLGCGDGELIWHLARELEGSAWFGVEISQQRVNLQSRDVAIWQGDMLEESLHGYNVLHADNLCLDEATADALEKKIACEFQGIYITYRRPENILFLRMSELLVSVETETTWSSCVIHFYRVY